MKLRQIDGDWKHWTLQVIRNHMPELSQRYSAIWVIEYAWLHRRTDILEGLDPSLWPDDILVSLTLEHPWRLRAGAARACAIVRSRDVGSFLWVIDFLEVIYRLLPTLVAPIKHMKIMFGLKTMVIMWMLREDQGMICTVVKTIKFFPSRLPQYQGCSRREMNLMRKNQRDFKVLARTLALNKTMRRAYIKDVMEQHYGEIYAQKLEDRLLHYLHHLDTVLPRETHIDQLLKKEPQALSCEEKLLVGFASRDSTSIAASLNRLLLHAVSSRCGSRAAAPGEETEREPGPEPEPEPEPEPAEETRLTEGRPSRADGPEGQRPWGARRAGSVEGGPGEQEEGLEAAGGPEDKDSPLLLEDEEEEDDSEGKERRRGKEEKEERSRARREEEEPEERTEKEEEPEAVHNRGVAAGHEDASPRQLCSRHQRWVRSILQGCSEELTPSATPQELIPASPTTPSSEDLTPSLPLLTSPSFPTHVPLFPNLPLSTQTPTPPETETRPPPSASSSEALAPSPSLLSPAHHPLLLLPLRPPSAPPEAESGVPPSTAITDRPLPHTAGLRHRRPLTHPRPHRAPAASSDRHPRTPAPPPAETTSAREPMIPRFPGARRLVVRLRRLDRGLLPPRPPSPSVHPGGAAEHLPQHRVSGNTQTPAPPLRPGSLPQPHPRSGSSLPSPLSEWAGGSDAPGTLRMSLGTQALLLRSRALQPSVALTRLRPQRRDRATQTAALPPKEEETPSGTPRPTEERGEEEETGDDEEEQDASVGFDVNTLYSSCESGSDDEDRGSRRSDPSYDPHRKQCFWLTL